MSLVQSPDASSIHPAAAPPLSQHRTISPEHLHFPYTADKELLPDFILYSSIVNQSTGLKVSPPPTNLDDSTFKMYPEYDHFSPPPLLLPSPLLTFPNKYNSKRDPLKNINHSMSHLCSSYFPCSIRPYMRSNLYEENIHSRRIIHSSTSINSMPGNFFLTHSETCTLIFFPLSFNSCLLPWIVLFLLLYWSHLWAKRQTVISLINLRRVVEI